MALWGGMELHDAVAACPAAQLQQCTQLYRTEFLNQCRHGKLVEVLVFQDGMCSTGQLSLGGGLGCGCLGLFFS